MNRGRARAQSGTIATALLVIGLGMGVASCSSIETVGGPPPEDMGSYTASVVGDDINANISGNAIFGLQENNLGGSEWVVFMWTGVINSNAFDVITIFRENLEIPAPGTYEIHDVEQGAAGIDDFLAGYVFAGSTAFAAFLSTSGTITITSSSDEEVRGTFEFTGALDDASFGVTAETATLSGSFTAVPGIIPN